MIDNYKPQPYTGNNPFPTYVSNIVCYELLGTVAGDYTIILGRLFVGESLSAGNPLAHALFESYTDHGNRAKIVRTRANGFNRVSMALINAMLGAGVEFKSVIALPPETALTALGDWFTAHNSEILSYSVVSQSCH